MRPPALAVLLALTLAAASAASAETEWCASRRRACERACGSKGATDFDCRDKGSSARSVSCSCVGGAPGARDGDSDPGDAAAALADNPAVNMLQGIGAWPMGSSSNKGGSGAPRGDDAPSAPSFSSPSFLQGSSKPSAGQAIGQSSTGKAVGIAVGVTAAVCACVAALAVAASRRRARTMLPTTMPPPLSPAKTVD